jgi:hypothetical protein
MVDDTGNVLINSSKTVVCEGGGATTNVKRAVFFQSPKNCENSVVPGDSSTGSITSTGTGVGWHLGLRGEHQDQVLRVAPEG